MPRCEHTGVVTALSSARPRDQREPNNSAIHASVWSGLRPAVSVVARNEWQATPDGKQPYFLHDDKVLNMAGLYELWRDPAKDNDDPTRWLWTATVLMTAVI